MRSPSLRALPSSLCLSCLSFDIKSVMVTGLHVLVEQEAAGHLKPGSFPGGACLSSTFVALPLLVAPAAPAPPPHRLSSV